MLSLDQVDTLEYGSNYWSQGGNGHDPRCFHRERTWMSNFWKACPIHRFPLRNPFMIIFPSMFIAGSVSTTRLHSIEDWRNQTTTGYQPANCMGLFSVRHRGWDLRSYLRQISGICQHKVWTCLNDRGPLNLPWLSPHPIFRRIQGAVQGWIHGWSAHHLEDILHLTPKKNIVKLRDLQVCRDSNHGGWYLVTQVSKITS